jgi:hypothetical protein
MERLDGRRTSRGPLRLARVTRGRFPEERNAVVLAGDSSRPVVRLKHFAGRPAAHARPWIEASVEREDEAFARELVAALASLLPPGGYLMLAYGDDETEAGLRLRFPPAVTPLGAALLNAGCTWFKDWYYPEGGMEGGFKLQGNLPLTDEARTRELAALRREVSTWLDRVHGSQDDLVARARARAATFLGLPA